MEGTRIKILLYLATLCFHCSTSSLTSYDCSSTTILEYDVPISDLLPPCQTIRESDKYWVKIIELSTQKIIAYRCKITFAETLVDVNGFSRIVTNGSEDISRDACLEAHKTKYLNLSGDRVFLKTNRTVNHQVPVGDHYDFVAGSRNKTRKYRYIKTYDITLSEYVGTVDLQQNVIRFDDNVLCDYDNYTCNDEQFGLFAWKALETEKYSTIYSGSINFAILSESLMRGGESGYAVITSTLVHKVFLLSMHGELTINGHRAYLTELPNVYIVLSEYDNAPRGWEYDGRLKNVYSLPNYSKHIDVVDIAMRRCISENHGLYIRLKSLPTFSRVLFAEMGTMGIKINKPMGSFSVQKCEKNQVVVRQTEQCYREIPVRDKETKERFLNPLSRVLIDDAMPMPCEQQHQYGTSTEHQLLWVETPTEHAEATVETSSDETATSTETSSTATETPATSTETPATSTETPVTSAVYSASTADSVTEKLKVSTVRISQESVCVYWVKVLGLVSLSLWVFIVVGRMFKLVICCVPKNDQNEGKSKTATFCSVGTVAGLLKPPFMGGSFNRNRESFSTAKQPEPAVSYVV